MAVAKVGNDKCQRGSRLLQHLFTKQFDSHGLFLPGCCLGKLYISRTQEYEQEG